MARRFLLVAAVAAIGSGVLIQSASAALVRPVKHVFIVVLENEKFASSFGPAAQADPALRYLAKDLPAQGALLSNYYATSHMSLGNYITMVSGQPANVATQADCPSYSNFISLGSWNGIAIGQGCVYPSSVKTVADQLQAKGLTWKGYMEGMATPCQRVGVGTADITAGADGHTYAQRHNPFLYFHSIVDNKSNCEAKDVPYSRFDADLRSVATTPNYSFIVPDNCNSAHDDGCGLKAANTWLKTDVVPKILASPAYQQDGLLIVAFDEAEFGIGSDSTGACCSQPTGPNTPLPGILGRGGGRTGAVVLSKWTRPGTVSSTAYNHYGLLRSTQEAFGLPYLGYSGQPGVASFGPDIFNR